MPTKTKRLTATVADLLSWRPCNEWTEERIRKLAGRKRKWTALDVLRLEGVPAVDKLWVVLRKELIPERDLHELACRFAEHVLPIWEREYPDDGRPRAAIEAKRAWLRGEIDDAQLAAAGSAGSAWSAAGYAAWFAGSAAWFAGSAAGFAGYAGYAARSAAGSAEATWQVGCVLEYLESDHA